MPPPSSGRTSGRWRRATRSPPSTAPPGSRCGRRCRRTPSSGGRPWSGRLSVRTSLAVSRARGIRDASACWTTSRLVGATRRWGSCSSLRVPSPPTRIPRRPPPPSPLPCLRRRRWGASPRPADYRTPRAPSSRRTAPLPFGVRRCSSWWTVGETRKQRRPHGSLTTSPRASTLSTAITAPGHRPPLSPCASIFPAPVPRILTLHAPQCRSPPQPLPSPPPTCPLRT
jgi:hypothetical protein